MKKTVLNGRVGFHLNQPLLEAGERLGPSEGAVGVGAGQKVELGFIFMITTRAAAVVPKLPVTHHMSHTKEPADVFGDPELVKGRKLLGGCVNGRPVNIVEGVAGDGSVVDKFGEDLLTKHCITNSRTRVGCHFPFHNIALPTFVCDGRGAARDPIHRED